MLKELLISNLVLVEQAGISFTPGLNTITGETGSGKSAVLAALSLASGERADAALVRHGTEKGVVEAIFDISAQPQLLTLLQEAGIDHNAEDDLIIKREIAASGKGRVFINHQPAQVSLLKRLGELLLEASGQNAHTKLKTLEEHRRLLDTYAGLTETVKEFAASWEEETRLRKALKELIESEALHMREMEICRLEIEELSEAAVKEGEDEELFSEYSLLSQSEERAALAEEALDYLKQTAALNRLKQPLERLQAIDPVISDANDLIKTALLELEEASYLLQKYASRIESDPKRTEALNNRLTLISKLKKKYGATVAEMHAYLAGRILRLQELENRESTIEELQAKIASLHQENSKRAEKLSQERRVHAEKLAHALTAEIHTLNMPSARFEIELTPQDTTRHGKDRIEFFLWPNKGEARIAIRECASGGELSRVMLALYTLLAGKEAVPTLIFDEIDANIGGETATVVGQKLQQIGKRHQLLCITHFAQVAKHADHHLKIYKEEREGRTRTNITALASEDRELELARMRG